MVVQTQNCAPNQELFNPGRTLLITNTNLNGKQSDIFIDESGIIQQIIKTGSRSLHNEAEHIIDADGDFAFPAFTNTHTHSAMTLLRGYADDMYLEPWLFEKIFPLEGCLQPDDVYWGTKLACLEMIKSGTVAFNDMYFFMEDTARAVVESGMKAVLSYSIPLPPCQLAGGDPVEEGKKTTEKFVRYIHSLENPRIKPGVAPHSVYLPSRDEIEWYGRYAEENDLTLHIHLSETKTEVDECRQRQGIRPPKYLDECGCLSSRTIAAHCCWLNLDECALLGERGVHAAYNPASNMKLSTRRAMPYSALINAGVNVTLATDGCSSNNNHDLLEDARVAAMLQKYQYLPTTLPAHEVYNMMTKNGAKALGLGAGEIKVGVPADIILVSRKNVANVPVHNPVSNLIYSLTGSAVRTTICNGQVLMHNRVVPGEEDILNRAQSAASKLVDRYDERENSTSS